MKYKIIVEVDTDENTIKAEAWKSEPGKITCERLTADAELLTFLQRQLK